ncbi:ABC transporter permease [Bacillus sp. 2205SS5-2]|uniref:ABC transporter permease n=1 Tax=Bacillus sp. 2205SS5-2 TaxID=3109031 RepID=UPI003007EC0C
MKKLPKSVLKDILSSKLQYGGVILLILLSVLLYVMLSASLSAVENSNEQFKTEYAQEDFHFYVATALNDEDLLELEAEYDVMLEKRLSYDMSLEDEKVLRVFSVPNRVNTPYLQEGTLPGNRNEIALSATFADSNSYSIGESISIEGEGRIITGLVYIPDYIYSLKNESALINDPAAFGVGLLPEEAFEEVAQPSVYYLGKWDNKEGERALQKAVSLLSPIIKWTNAQDNPRISYIETEIKSTKSFATVFPLFISVIAVMMVVILVKRRLESQKKQIGTQLALGYQSRELTKAYLLYPLVIGILGSTIGLVFGLLLSVPMTNMYTYYFNLPVLSRWTLTPIQYMGALIIPSLLLILVGYVVIRKYVNILPIRLIKPLAKQSAEGRFHFSFTKIKKFSTRFRLRMLSKNFGRILYLTLGILFATMLLMYGFISMNSIDTLMTKTYKEGLNYEYGVYYQELKQSSDSSEDVFTISEAEVIEVNRKGEWYSVSDQRLQLFGLDRQTDSISLKNSNNESLKDQLEEGLIINKVVAYALGVEVGDQLSLKLTASSREETIKVAGIAELYAGSSVYMQRSTLNAWNDFSENSYMGKWTQEEPVAKEGIYQIENKQELMQSLENMMGPMRYSLLIMSGLAFLIGLIIITLITNLIVEENITSISLLKVIGYEDKTVSHWMLNIYTPVVIISYGLGVPSALLSIDALMKSLAKETNYALPVAITPGLFIIGFLIIFGAYWASLWISKRKLKRVSLQEVLKRQEA